MGTGPGRAAAQRVGAKRCSGAAAALGAQIARGLGGHCSRQQQDPRPPLPAVTHLVHEHDDDRGGDVAKPGQDVIEPLLLHFSRRARAPRARSCTGDSPYEPPLVVLAPARLLPASRALAAITATGPARGRLVRAWGLLCREGGGQRPGGPDPTEQCPQGAARRAAAAPKRGLLRCPR